MPPCRFFFFLCQNDITSTQGFSVFLGQKLQQGGCTLSWRLELRSASYSTNSLTIHHPAHPESTTQWTHCTTNPIFFKVLPHVSVWLYLSLLYMHAKKNIYIEIFFCCTQTKLHIKQAHKFRIRELWALYLMLSHMPFIIMCLLWSLYWQQR